MNQQLPDAPERNARIIKTVRAHEWKRRLLTGTALLFSFLAIALGMALAWLQVIKLEPKQNELLEGYRQSARDEQSLTNSLHQSGISDFQSAQMERKRELLHINMTHYLGIGMMLVAASVALVGVGTLVTVVLIMVNRRVTLQQINENLAQISAQIKEMQNRPGS